MPSLRGCVSAATLLPAVASNNNNKNATIVVVVATSCSLVLVPLLLIVGIFVCNLFFVVEKTMQTK